MSNGLRRWGAAGRNKKRLPTARIEQPGGAVRSYYMRCPLCGERHNRKEPCGTQRE